MKFDTRDLPTPATTDLTVENIRIVRERLFQNRVENTWMHTKESEIVKQALNIVEQLKSEPSEEMVIHIDNISQPLFQAMRDQQIREARDEE